MIRVASHVACGRAFHSPGRMGKAVPDRFAFAVLVPASFDLISGRCRPKDKFRRKIERRESHLRVEQITDEATPWSHDGKGSRGTECSGQEFTAIEVVPFAHRASPHSDVITRSE